MKRLKKSLCIILTLCITAVVFPSINISAVDVTELTLPNIYMDNMVLQSGKEVKIVGQAPSGRNITATLCAGVNTFTASATPGSDCNFSAEFTNVFDPGYTQYILSITDGVTTKTFSNIVFGDVYILAGQSNMAWPTAYYLGNTVGDERTAVQAAINSADNNNLRFLDLARDWNTSWAQPQTNIHTNYNWTSVTKTNVNDLSAIGYFYGREMQAEKNYPIGLISTAMNGSQIYYWLPIDGVFMGDYPGYLFNSMINPFRSTNIKGVLWYQGESDTGARATEYYGKLNHLIDCYKNIFGSDIGFGMVQITNLDGDYGIGYHDIRESQFRVFYDRDQAAITAGTQNNVGLVSAIDQQYHDPYGNAGLHPEGKMEVAHRLAKWAESAIYGNGQEYAGPVLKSYKVDGNNIELTYTHVGSGLKGKNGATTITGFKVAGSDSVLYDATGAISGTDKVIITSPVAAPNFLQYANQDFNPSANLMNSADFAAYPINTINLTGDGTFNPPSPLPSPTPTSSSSPIQSPGPTPSSGSIPGDKYKVGDSFSLYARDIYSNAGKNDPYGYSRAIDIDNNGNEVFYPATDQHYGGGEWEFTNQYGEKVSCNIYSSGICKLGQGVLYVLNDKAKGFNTKVSVSIMPSLQHASWSAIVTYDGGKTTGPILVYDSVQNTVINGVNYDSWGYTFDREIGTWPNVESVKIYISGNGWYNPDGVIPYKATFTMDSAMASPSLGEITAINVTDNKVTSVDITSESKASGNLIVATYDGNDILTGIKIAYVPDANYINGFSNVAVNLNIPSGSVKVKAMFIDTLGNIKPIADSLTKELQ